MENLNRPITSIKTVKKKKKIPTNKSPGLDDFTGECYQNFTEELTPILLKPMNSMKKQKCRTLKYKLPRQVGAQYATGDQWKNNSGKNEGMEPKKKQHQVVNGTGDRSKARCCEEKQCIGTWNVRSMIQGKLELVKQETTRVNINILGVSELKWTGMGEFNSDYHYIYYCGQETLRRNGEAIIFNKRV